MCHIWTRKSYDLGPGLFTLPYMPINVHRSCYPGKEYVPPQRLWFLRRFGLKKGINFRPNWSGFGYGFRVKNGSI